LAGEGFEVILSTITDAIDFLDVMIPDVILLDVQIAGFDKTGDQICAASKKQQISLIPQSCYFQMSPRLKGSQAFARPMILL